MARLGKEDDAMGGSSEELIRGQVFRARYRVVDVLGRGTEAVVYGAEDVVTHEPRALKVMSSRLLRTDRERAEFCEVMRSAAKIRSPHLVELFDVGVDEASDAPFLLMERLRGQHVGALVEARGRLDAALVLELLSQVALALDRAHGGALLHRYLEPRNLFVTKGGDGKLQLKVIGLGVAQALWREPDEGVPPVGSWFYVAPEQTQGLGFGPGVDVYALAQIAFTMLVGTPYWLSTYEAHGGDRTAYLQALVDGCARPATEAAADLGVELPRAFDAWFARATTTIVTRRFASAGALVKGLSKALRTSAKREKRTIPMMPKLS